jgi:hypothetical protein
MNVVVKGVVPLFRIFKILAWNLCHRPTSMTKDLIPPPQFHEANTWIVGLYTNEAMELPQTLNALFCKYRTIWYDTATPTENVIKEIIQWRN